MEFFLQLVITGIMVGSIYARVALGAERGQRTDADLTDTTLRASVRSIQWCPL
jgi:hypothetical protein